MGDLTSSRGRTAATTRRPIDRLARRTGLALAVAAGLAAGVPAAASALPVDYAFTDSTDVASSPAYDLTKGTVTLDAEKGSISAHLEVFADFDPTSPTVVDVVTGLFNSSGKCTVETTPFVLIAGAVSPNPADDRDFYMADARWGVGSPTNLWAYADGRAAKKAVNVTLDSQPALVGRMPPCLLVRTFTADRWANFVNFDTDPTPVSRADEILDTAQANIVNPVTDPGVVPTPGPVATPAPVLDSDKDGVPDASDSCRNEPGPAPTGCPAKKNTVVNVPVVSVMRLGARKIALDRTIPKAVGNAACPAKAKVVVTQNRKRLGAVKLATVDAGANGCRLKGNVKIKRYKKKKSLQVTMSAPGLTTTKQKLKT